MKSSSHARHAKVSTIRLIFFKKNEKDLTLVPQAICTMRDPNSASLIVRAGATFATLTARSVHRVPVGLAASGVAAGVSAGVRSGGGVSFADAGGGGEGVEETVRTVEDGVTDANAKSALMSIGQQVSFGGMLGYATGFTIRKVGKAVLFLVGAEVVLLQYMSYRHWVNVDWNRLSRDLSPKMSKSSWESFVNVLLYRLPFSTAFSGGLIAALRTNGAR